MICLYAETHLSTFTLILYTFVWIPFLQITQTFVRFFTFLIDPHRQACSSSSCDENPEWELDLPVSRFQELELMSNKNGGEASCDDHGDEMCSICLTEFEKEELVNKLPKCGHVFHVGCLEKWLDRCQFTCPLCRSMLLHVRSSSPCKTWASSSSPFCINLPHN
ncbi:UNVERIFIED_CONTAM: E3 ubiquitin-protein ligase RHA1B [Sesamum radiatum]|uniref:E3 ubiquitin-protein ligase RHA1B n=1 Tax=Sesamum radiatum TaxID=300843 RepID=A0AAW2LTP0_SESRA